MRIVLITLLICVCSYALVYSPRIAIEGQPDFYSLETITKSIIKKEMTNKEKAEAVWRFVLASTFHYKSPEEGLPDNGIRFEMNTLEDPLKLLNSYGYLYCFANVSLMTKLWEAAGFDSTRVWGIGGHLISEVYYDGAWHHYDGDQSVSSYFIKADGKTAASIDEIQKNPEYYILNPKFRSNPQMPFDTAVSYEHESREVLARFYRTNEDNYIRDRMGVTTHKMDYYLKKYEDLTLYFEPQGKWRQNGMDVASINPANGPFDAHGNRKYGNGLFVYKPNLNDQSILDDGMNDVDNITLDNGIKLKDPAKRGEFTVKTLSPWVITGKPIGASTASDGREQYCGAATVSGWLHSVKNPMAILPCGIEILIRTEKNHNWESVYKFNRTGHFSVDLSKHFSMANYYYEVKVVLEKDTVGVKLENFSLETWVQVNPASLPSLKAGNNKIRFSTSPSSLDKVTYEHGSIPGAPVDAFVVSMDNVSVTKDPAKRFIQADTSKPATVVLKLESKNGAISDYWADMLFHQRETGSAIVEYSENDTLSYKKFNKKAKLHHDHWADWHSIISLAEKKNTTAVYFKVKLNGKAALCVFNSGYRYPFKKANGKVNVEFTVDVDGKEKIIPFNPEGNKGEENINLKGSTIRNRSIKFISR
ncbi:MAG: hypothetical protein JNL74_13610 [Fibrobacteres bacterium]|nr:hypothetical protein [Fibrobacterota bacterium]